MFFSLLSGDFREQKEIARERGATLCGCSEDDYLIVQELHNPPVISIPKANRTSVVSSLMNLFFISQS